MLVPCALLFEQRERRPRRLAIERSGVLDALRLRAEGGEHRHLARERGAQRVDGLDAQPRRVLLEAPAERAVALERRARVLPGESLVCGSGGRSAVRACASASSTRLRISAAAFLVKVIATISSGLCTRESSTR